MTRSRFGVRFVAPLLAALLLAPTIVRADPPTAAQARSIWRDYITDGVSSSCPGGVACYNPKKSEIRTFMGGLADAVGGLWTADKFFSPVDYGAACDGTTDDATAFGSAMTAAGAGGVVRIPQHKRCRVSALSVPAGVTLIGWWERPDFTSGGNTSLPLGSMPGLLLDSAGSITLAQGSMIGKMYIQKYGMTFPQTDATGFGGNALTFGGSNAIIKDVLAVGFDKCVRSTAAYISRFQIDGLYCDGNNGIYLTSPSYDTGRITNSHLFPFATQPNTSCAALQRPGSGLYLTSNQDDTWIDNFLALGYKYNINLLATGSVGMGKVWLDYPAACASGSASIGLYAQTNVTGVTIGQAWVWGSEFGIVAAMNPTEKIKITAAHVQTIASHGITVSGGDVDIAQLELKTIGGYGFNISSNSSRVRARGLASGVTSNLVAAPSGGVTNLLDIDMHSDGASGLAAGQPRFGINAVAPQSLTSAATINLPIFGDSFTISGSTGPIATIAGVWGGREITLTFLSTPTLNESGNLKLATATYVAAANDKIKFVYDSNSSKWVEVVRGPDPARLSRASAPAASACGTSPTVDSGSNNFAGKFTTGSAGTSCTLTFASGWATAPYCVVTPMAAPAAIANVPYISAQSTSAFTAAGLTASTAFNYHCGGSQ